MLMLVGYMLGLIFSGLFFVSWWEVCFLYFVAGVVVLLVGGVDVGTYWCLSYGLGFDLMSWGLVLLSVWLGAVVLMSSTSGLSDYYYILLLNFLVFFLLLSFMVMSYIWFYIFFESSLIPIMLIIMGWGYQPERLEAGVFLMFYTLFGSLPLLLSYLFMGDMHSSLVYGVVWWYFGGGCFWLFFSVLAFLVSMPMFLTHLWLPSAHVEAPAGGSMFLAGVLLKLGGYGILRLAWIFLSSIPYGLGFIIISVVGAVIVSFLCLRQFDIKALIAYSSVAHMGLVVGGIFVVNSWGWGGALVLMLGHGLCSSGLFCLSGVVYERAGSRSMYLNSGLSLVLPGLSLWWIMLSACNMAAPPSMNLMGEVMLLLSMYGWCSFVLVALVVVSFFGAAYTLYLYSISQHGDFSASYGFSEESLREHGSLFFHWVPINLLVLSGDLLYLWF